MFVEVISPAALFGCSFCSRYCQYVSEVGCAVLHDGVDLRTLCVVFTNVEGPGLCMRYCDASQ